MNERLIELGLHDDRERPEKPASPTPSNLTSFAGRLLSVVSATAIESDTLNTPNFRARIEKYRQTLESSTAGDPNVPMVANDCLRLCQDYLVRSRAYLLERETEFADVIEVMRVALGKLAGEANAFNVRVKGSSERLNRLTEIGDIRELKKRICEEVSELNRTVREKQRQDEQNHARLSNRIEVLQTSLSRSREEASIDPLTGVANRGTFDMRLAQWVDIHRENQKPFILAMLDLDNFKQINDTHGHQVGDRVLLCASQWFGKYMRSTDVLARYGGEEFVVMLTDVGLPQAEAKFVELLASLANCNYAYKREDEECSVRFTASCGLAEFTVNESGEDLLRRADEALYLAKRTGKNRVVLAKSEQSMWKTLLSRGLARSTKQKP